MIGLAQFLFGKEKSSGKADQRRRGRVDTKEEESPGEELRSEMRNAIWSESTEKDGEFGIAESA